MGRIEFWHGLRGSRDNHILTFFNIAGGKTPQGQNKIYTVLEIKRPAKISGQRKTSQYYYTTKPIKIKFGGASLTNRLTPRVYRKRCCRQKN